MAIALLILSIIAIVIGATLLRGLPRRRQIGLAIFAAIWTGIVVVIGYSIGEIAPQYRGNIALQRLLRDAAGALEVGNCDQARAAFLEANRFVESGGSVHEAATMVSERLHGVSNDTAPPIQPE